MVWWHKWSLCFKRSLPWKWRKNATIKMSKHRFLKGFPVPSKCPFSDMILYAFLLLIHEFFLIILCCFSHIKHINLAIYKCYPHWEAFLICLSWYGAHLNAAWKNSNSPPCKTLVWGVLALTVFCLTINKKKNDKMNVATWTWTLLVWHLTDNTINWLIRKTVKKVVSCSSTTNSASRLDVHLETRLKLKMKVL